MVGGMARTLRIELPSACRLDALIDGIPQAYSYAPASNRLTAIATPTASRVLSLDAAGNLTCKLPLSLDTQK